MVTLLSNRNNQLIKSHCSIYSLTHHILWKLYKCNQRFFFMFFVSSNQSTVSGINCGSKSVLII